MTESRADKRKCRKQALNAKEKTLTAKSGKSTAKNQATTKVNTSGTNKEIAETTTNVQDNFNRRTLQRSNPGCGESGSQSSRPDSLGDDKQENEAFWGLVSLFIKCHEGENKEFKEGEELLSLMPGNSIDSIQHKQSKSNSKVAKQGANKDQIANSNKQSVSNSNEGAKNDAGAGQGAKSASGKGKSKGGKKTV